MERKIGEIFEYNGEWYQCVESEQDACTDCAFNPINGIGYNCSGSCTYKQVIFKKLEKVGEPYYSSYYKQVLQEYKYYTSPIISDTKVHILKQGIVRIEIKQTKEDMEEQHSTENYPKEDEVATRIANKVGEDIRDQLEKNLNKEDTEENKTTFPKEDNALTRTVYAYVNGEISDKELIRSIKEMSDEYPYNKNNLKPFSLELAKQSKPVCTRDGRKARIICFDFRDADEICCIIAAVDYGEAEKIHYYDLYGKYRGGDSSEYDLMMLPEKKEGWVNVYKTSINYECGTVFSTEQEAKNKANDNRIATVRIEWEE